MKENTENEQILLEQESRDLSNARFGRQLDMAEKREDAENTDLGRALVNALIKNVTVALEEACSKSSSGTPGRQNVIAGYLGDCDLGSEEIAFIALRATIGRSLRAKNEQVTDAMIAQSISARLEDELFLRGVKKERQGLVQSWEKECADRALTRDSARRFMRRQARNMEMGWVYTDPKGRAWDERRKLKIGRYILELIITSTNILYLKTVRVRKRQSKKFAYLTKEFEHLVSKAKSLLMERSVFWLPMVVKPKPWSVEEGLYGGGYLTDEVRPYPLVKRANFEWLDEIVENDPSVLLNAINAVQDTPWRVNPTILNTLDEVFAWDKELANLPSASKRPLPPAPEEFDKDYRRQCWEVHEYNRKQLTKRLSVLQVLSLAKKFSAYPKIYFPHDLDSRGRAYPKPAFLNPQGPDYVKALLEFAEGKPLGSEDAAAWLAVHVANCWGEDKLALDDRIAWTQRHEELIVGVAEAPLDDLRWTQADAPFQFLAAALAWKGFLDEGLDYVCHVPIAVDATCSGLQHYSAMLRDPVGGRAVNLMDLPERQDVYMDVAKVATELIKEDLGTDNNNLAEAWLKFGVTRKITKRSVMVVPYAATFMACMNYTREAVQEALDKGCPMPWSGDDGQFITYGSKKIWEAIEKTVVAASGAMRWISMAANEYSKNKSNTHLRWGTPSGMVVRHRKPQTKPWRLDTVLDGSRITMQANTELITLDRTRMSSSTPPSFVHSMDAAHMCLAIDASVEAGLTSFGVVHDSFSTHAADMEVFGHCIRDTFHEMYTSQDILEGLRQQLQEGLDEPLPELPPKGDLDLNEVRTSTFFFS